MRSACVTPTVIPRSLNEPVGFMPSCLRSSGVPAQRWTEVRSSSGVFPSGHDTGAVAVGSTMSRKRHTPEPAAPANPGAMAAKRCTERRRVEARVRMHDLEQPSASGAARIARELIELVPAVGAALPAAARGRHSKAPGPETSRAPPVSTASVRITHSMPAAA